MDIKTVIQLTYSASDNKQQKAAEDSLYALFSKDPGTFFLSMAAIINDESVDENIRQQAGTIIGRYILTPGEDGKYVWDYVNPQQAEQIRADLLVALGSKKELAKRSASHAISKIATVDIPQGKWQHLIPTLLNVAGNQDLQFKRAAITALGFLCAELKQHNINLSEEDCKAIIGSVYLGVTSTDLEVKRESLISLAVCISYMEQILEYQEVRHKILYPVIQCLDVMELGQVTLQFFIEYAKCHFKHLKEIAEHLWQKTSVIIKQCDHRSIAAIEVWYTIAEMQVQNQSKGSKLPNVIEPFLSAFIPIFSTLMTICDRDEQNHFRDGAFRTLIPVCEVYFKQCAKQIVEYAGSCLVSQDWKHKQCASMILSTIAGSHESDVIGYLEIGLNAFFQIVNDTDNFVVSSNLIGLARILEFHGSYLLKKKNWQEYIDLLVKQLEKGQDVQTKALDALAKMTECFEKPEFSCQLANNVLPLTSTMSFLLSKNVPANTLQVIGIVIIHLLQGNRDAKITRQFLEHIVDEAVANKETDEGEKNLKSCYLVILHACLLSMKQVLDTETAFKITNMLLEHFYFVQTVDVDGLYVIGALSIRSGDNFLQVYPSLLPFVDHGLTLDNEPAILKVVMGVLGDISKSIGKYKPEELDKFLNFFEAKFLQTTDRDFKITLITGLGDLIREINNQQVIDTHIDKLINVANICVSACLRLIHNNEDPEYTDELREAIRELFECMCSGPLRNNYELIGSLLNSATNFIIQTANKNANPSLNHYKKGFLLVFDIACSLISTNKKQIIDGASEILSNPTFIQLFNEQRNIAFDDEVKGLQSYGRAVFGALKVTGIEFI